MNLQLAQKLLEELVNCRKALDAAEFVAREIEDEILRNDLRRTSGSISLDLYTEAMGKIFLKYPELNPLSG